MAIVSLTQRQLFGVFWHRLVTRAHAPDSRMAQLANRTEFVIRLACVPFLAIIAVFNGGCVVI